MRVFTVLGPSHSGKTTLLKALVGLEQQTPDSFSVAGVASAHAFDFMGERWVGLDFAGGTDTLAQAGPALAASDAAVLCVPADPEAAVLSAPFLRRLDEAGIPTLVFINGIDKAAGRVSEIVSALQVYCAHNIILRQVPMRDGDEIVGAVDLISERAWKYQEGQPSSLIGIPEHMLSREQGARTELLESLADFDDHLLEQLIEDQAPMAEEVYDVASRALQHGDLVPALIGSAEHRNGILRLMKSLRHEAPTHDVARLRTDPEGKAMATGMLADQVKHLGKTVLLRAFDSGVQGGAGFGGDSLGSLTGLDGKTPVKALKPGEVALAVKSDHVRLGTFVTPEAAHELPGWATAHTPSFRRFVTPTNERDETRLPGALERLSEIDPGFTLSQDERTGHIILSCQGPLHLRRLSQKLTDVFGIEAEDAEVPVSLRETIEKPAHCHHRHRKQSGGAGQFADIVIDVRPEARGAGFTFTEEVKGGAVPRNYIPAVETGVRESLAEGPHGHPVIDLSVVLKDGKHHAVDSSDFAFRTAGRNGMREALAETGTILLQPIMKVQIQVPSVFAGGLVPTISSLKGQVLGFDGHPTAAGWDVFDCLLPMGALEGLYSTLGSSTRGTAWFAAEFDHFEKVRADELVSA